MNKTLAALLTTSAFFLFGAAQAADETPADQQPQISASAEATQEATPANMTPGETAASVEKAESSSDSPK